MIVKCYVPYAGQEASIVIPQSCYDRIESIFEEFVTKCRNITEDNLDDLVIESGKCRSKINSYLLALYDLGEQDYADNATLRIHYSDKILIAYENALDNL